MRCDRALLLLDLQIPSSQGFSIAFTFSHVSLLSVLAGVKVIDDRSTTAVFTHAEEESIP